GRVLQTSTKDVQDKRHPLRNVPFSVIDAYNELYRARRQKESHKLPKKRFYFTRIGRFAPPLTDESEPQPTYEAH
ncbi:hypothetical protein AAVH_33690, partial [Aphelenchoides avenae]